MNRVIHFEIGVESPERAVKFYEEVFGWEIAKWDGPQSYWLIKTGADDEPGIDGGIMRHQDALPRVVNTIAVSSIDEFSTKVTQSGGEVVLAKMTIPGVGYQAYCRDTEGNVFGIHQADPTAG